jgi:hypothetical protein
MLDHPIIFYRHQQRRLENLSSQPMTYGSSMSEDAPEERLTCGCRLWGDKPQQGCLTGQDIYRRMEGLASLIAVWPRLAGREGHLDADWKPHDDISEARAGWQEHLEAGGHNPPT